MSNKQTVAKLEQTLRPFTDLVKQLSYEQLKDATAVIAQIEQTIDRRRQVLLPEYLNQRQKISNERIAVNRARERRVIARVFELGDALIGKIVKVKGTRDGHGFRQIISIDYDRREITCHRFERHYEGIGKVARGKLLHANLQCHRGNLVIKGVTTHGFGNITHYNPNAAELAVQTLTPNWCVVTVEPFIQ